MSKAPALSSVLASTRFLIDAGASLHWLFPYNYVDGNGNHRGKSPRNGGWSDAPSLNYDQLKSAYVENSNIGIRLGEPSRIGDYYLHIIDLDIRVESKAAEAWEALLALWPDVRDFPSVISGSGGESRHFYFLTDKPFGKMNVGKSKNQISEYSAAKGRDVWHHEWEIDLMGTGSQAVIPPSLHDKTHKPYRWEREIELDLLDIGLGPIVPSETVEGWGARSAGEDDDDDLESLFNSTPMDLDDDEIDRILADIPNDAVEIKDGKEVVVGAHYDDYIEVGMALHHQYMGDDHGFQKWVDWAGQSVKFNLKHARYRWNKSFGDAKRPVRMATLIQKANANRLAADHDFEIEDDEDLFATDSTTNDGLLDLDEDDSLLLDLDADDGLIDLLGPSAPVPAVVDIDSAVAEVSDKATESGPLKDWDKLLHRDADSGSIKSTLPNVRLMLENDLRTHGIVAFNEFRQELVLTRTPKRLRKKEHKRAREVLNLESTVWKTDGSVNGRLWEDAHDNEIRAVFEAPTTQGGYGIKISDRDLQAALGIVGQRNRFHPVRDLLEKLVWDGVPRASTLFIDYLKSPDDAYHREAARLMLLGAVTRIYEPGHKFDFVAIFEGAQGKGKSTFIRTLALHWFNELSGDPSDIKAMVELMQGSWVLEMGEMSAMAKAEVQDMKAFVTRTVDKVRMAYARRASENPRQCIFIGSTNESEYLKDSTGGRRWWPIQCRVKGMIDNPKLAREVLQIWAEVVHIYREMRRVTPIGELNLSMVNEAATEAAIIQESRRAESAEDILAGQIENWLDTPLVADDFDDVDESVPKVYRNETCVAQIWNEFMLREGVPPHAESMRIGKAMQQLRSWDRTKEPVRNFDLNKKYGKCRVYVRQVDDADG